MPVTGDDGPPPLDDYTRARIAQNTWWAYQDPPTSGFLIAVVEVVVNNTFTRLEMGDEPPAIFAEPTPTKRVFMFAEEGSDDVARDLMNLFDRMTNAEFEQMIRDGRLIQLTGGPRA
jgi:hypothetical protein